MNIRKVVRGARIIVEDWMNVQKGDKVLVLTDELHHDEMKILSDEVEKVGGIPTLHTVPKELVQNGTYFDGISELFDMADIIIGGTHYSIVTTKAVDRAVEQGKRFLSLPLATNSGKSLISYDFMEMDPKKADKMAKTLLPLIDKADTLRVTTKIGTDLTFRKIGRKGGYFNGVATKKYPFASSSFEVYVPMEETKTNGTFVIDGSLGYLGVPEQITTAKLRDGRIVDIQQNKTGQMISDYIASFEDDGVYYASEFGIGLNEKAICRGESYIEDESAYGTFHIGFGRNIGLGGELRANGHFDFVILEPDIYAGDILIMKDGEIIVS